MIKFKPVLLKAPIGGWHYWEDENCFRGDNAEEVAEKVRTYRIRNGKPVGDPDRDLLNYCAKNWPHLVNISPEEQPSDKTEEEIQLEWLHQWLTAAALKINFGDIEVERMKHQAGVCRECPFNQPIPKEPADLASDIERRSFLLRKGRDVPGVGLCTHHHWDARVACVRDRRTLSPIPDPPENCWTIRPLEDFNLRKA